MDPAQAAAVGKSVLSALPPQPHMTTAMVVGPPPPASHPAPSTVNSSMPRGSPKRVRLNAAQKQAVCDLLAGGARADYIVDTFGIAKRTVFKIQRAQRLRQAEELANRSAAAANNSSAKQDVGIAQTQPLTPIASSTVDPSTMMQDASGVPLGNPMAPNTDNINVATVNAGPMTITDGSTNPQVANAASATGSSKHAAPKKTTPPAKRVRLNVSEKLDICNFVQQGGTPAEVIEKYGISRRTFFKILHDEQDIRQTVDRDHVSAETKSIRPPHFPLLDQSLSAYVLSARAARVPLNWHMVREQALQLRTELLASGKERPERIPHLERFTASEHWCQLFMRKNANKKLPAALDDPVQPARRHAMKETKHLQSQLGDFDPDNVYTLVTPRLYYRYIPDRFFADLSNVRQQPMVTDGPSTGDEVEPFLTLLVAANLTGTKRLPIALIAPPGTEEMFGTRGPCLPFMIRPFQRCDSSAFAQWLREVFIPFVEANNGCKVALMLDETLAVSTSGSFGDFAEQVSLVLVPRLSICMTETAKNGIFPLLVARYRFKLFETYSALVPLREKLRKHAEIIPKQYRGLAEGGSATVYDASDILRDAWLELPADRVARCWWRMNVLPENLVASLRALYGNTNDAGTISEVSGFVLNIVRTNPVGKECLAAINSGRARWISVLEVIRWFTFEYEMAPKQEQIERSGRVEANGRMDQNGLDWNVAVPSGSSAMGISTGQVGASSVSVHTGVPVSSAPPSAVSPSPVQVPVGTSAQEPVTTGETAEMEIDGGRKYSHEQFAEAMRCYADLERCIVETRDTEALRNLRNAKKASLAHFVLNGVAEGTTAVDGDVVQ